jgi:hypothetical protein
VCPEGGPEEGELVLARRALRELAVGLEGVAVVALREVARQLAAEGRLRRGGGGAGSGADEMG